MDIEQTLAQTLFNEGGFCFCFDLPSGSDFGIDMKSFTTGDKFKGVKMIPPGLHFIYYSVENSYGDQSPRVGFFHFFKKKEIVVKKWDSEKEELIDEENEELIERLRDNLKTLDKNLGAYPFDVWMRWKGLTNKISENVTNKVVPLCQRIHSVLELTASQNTKSTSDQSNPNTSSKRQKTKLFLCDEVYDDVLPNLKAAEGTELRFTKIPDKCFPENSTPSEITKHSLDSSLLFENLLSQHDHFSDLLGEIQLSFICFLVGFSFEAFEHWKKLIGIMCSCDEAITKYSEVFSDFISVLNFQVLEVQEDFLVDIVAGNNFVYKILRIFFRNIQSGEVNGRLKAKAERFQEVLTEKLCWDFSDILEEDEDDLPVVVET